MLELLQQHLPKLSGAQHAQLARYYELLIEGNKKMNLTAITEKHEVVEKHFVDSLLAIDHIPQGARCIDVGTGAGFPGIPLLIARPDISLTLLDSLNKRVSFLRETVAALGLSADCLHARAEDAGQNPCCRSQFDIALSRAVASLPVLLELCVPFLKVGGSAICYKGKSAHEEAENANAAAAKLNCGLDVVLLGTTYGERALVLAKKLSDTPAKYPRRAGEPAKKPL
ncbi:16S rRNA (guanine(527)-N(7))-methyltransferase RsmG [Eubacteriales bacterium OttesenSCG-928-K08]|nr:16S rRNA (guanine(527)-N(7))-methyltransferase RsmG [Eubacteriales bacterium OttesenSCG-928-K08]